MKLGTTQLRPYQERDVNSILDAWQKYRTIMYQLPTGGGKSLVAAKIIHSLGDKRVLFIAHRRRLLTQMRNTLSSNNIDTGFIVGHIEENINANIVIASIRTIAGNKRIETILERDWDVIIIDEAHHSTMGSYEKILDNIYEKKSYLLLGLTATPYRKDKKRLDKYYQHLIVSDDVQKLINSGYLSKYRTFHTPIGQIEKEVSISGQDFNISQLSTYMRKPEYISYAVESYKKLGENRQALVFGVDKKHCRDLEKAFKKQGYKKIAYIDANVSEDDREDILNKYESGEIQIIISIEVLTEGTDLPDTGCILIARPTKSLNLYLQIIGRGLRLKSNGSDLIIIDIAGCTESFGTASSPKHWSLNPNIDPSNPRNKNVLVAKKKDGSYTENLDEEEFAQIEELTPEEYIAKMAHGIEKATEINVSIDKKISLVYTAIITLLGKTLKNGYFKCNPIIDVDKNCLYLIHSNEEQKLSQIKESKKTTSEAEIINRYFNIFATLDLSQQYYCVKVKDKNYNIKESDIIIFRDLSFTAGNLNSNFNDNANLNKKIAEYLEQIEDLKKQKIDIDQFEENAKKIKEDNFKFDVETRILNKERVFTLENYIRLSDYYNRTYWRERILEMKVLDSKMKKNLNVEITYVDTWSIDTITEDTPRKTLTRYIESEKFITMLKDGGWSNESKK